jgi:hypothetical protein
VDNVGPAEGDGVKEAQAGGHLVELAEGDALGDELELELADLLRGELIGGNAEVSGELDDGREVGLDGARRVVAQAEVVQEALAQRGHGRNPCRRPVGEE